MIDLPLQVNDTNGFRHAWNKLIRWCQSNTLQTSTDIKVTTNSSGTSLEISDKIKKKIGGASTPWKPFNDSASFAVNDLVYVDPNGTYVEPFTVASGSSVPALSAGLFQCSIPVPAVPARNTYNYYYPVCPTIPTSSVITFSGSVYNQTFWQPLAPMLPMQTCINGSSVTVFMNGQIIGATFDLTKLPYKI
jgi:hypothetical protein